MNDLPFILYKPAVMFCDTSGMRPITELAHRRLMDFLWLRDAEVPKDNEVLRKLTGCSESEWSKTKGELLQNGWVETSAFFIHRGAVKTLNESKQKHVAAFNKTASLNSLPRLKLLDPDPETGVTHYVTSNDTQSESPTDKHEQQDKQDYSLDSVFKGELLKGVNLRAVAVRICNNLDGWSYDNCKVARNGFTLAGIETCLRPYLKLITCKQAVQCWCEAVLKAHRDAVDGMITKTPEASCMDDFKRRLAEKSKGKQQ